MGFTFEALTNFCTKFNKNNFTLTKIDNMLVKITVKMDTIFNILY